LQLEQKFSASRRGEVIAHEVADLFPGSQPASGAIHVPSGAMYGISGAIG
jgi:hypothetical protein